MSYRTNRKPLEQEQRQLEAERQRQEQIARQNELERERMAATQRQAELERQRQAEAEAEAEEEEEEEEDQLSETELQGEVETQQDVEDRRSVVREEQEPQQPVRVAEAAPDSSLPAEQTSVELPPAPCPLVIPSDPAALRPEYPNLGRENYGDAEITVRYEIDELGQTVDEDVAVVREKSSAQRSRYFNEFAKAAIAEVRGWSFEFVEADDSPCTKRRTTETVFRFVYD